MAKVSLSSTSALLYRNQIRNIAFRMHDLAAQTVLHPLRNMAAFNRTEKDFEEVKKEALLCCSVMDNSRSIENEDRATSATTRLMTELIHLKNKASDLLENEANVTLEDRRGQSIPAVVALDTIKREYAQVITNDKILKTDFERLRQCIAVKSSAARNCQKIINHLIAEVKESAGDDQRMADESPTCGNDNSVACKHLQKHLKLRQALEDFRVTYLATSP